MSTHHIPLPPSGEQPQRDPAWKKIVRRVVPLPVRMVYHRARFRLTHRHDHHHGAAEFWDQQAAGPVRVMWLSYMPVRLYVNELLTGVPWVYPFVAFKIHFAYHPLARGLSIGSGQGDLERHARFLRICDHIDALDLSRESIRVARKKAREENVTGVRYRIADCNTVVLPRQKYDVVFFHGSLHHIADPDRLLDEVNEALKPGGFVYIDDYIGPSRNEWTDEHLLHARAEYARLDPKFRYLPILPPFEHEDPSEMIRSSRILPAMIERFDIAQYKPYWGNLLFPLLSHAAGNELQKPENEPVLQSLIEREKELVRTGEFRVPLFAVIVGRKRETKTD